MPIATEGQRTGPSVRFAIAAFHRLNAQGVSRSQGADVYGAEQWRQVAAEGQTQAEPLALGGQALYRAELEEPCQEQSSGERTFAPRKRRAGGVSPRILRQNPGAHAPGSPISWGRTTLAA